MKPLKDWLLGENVTTFAVLQRKERKLKKNGEPYWFMELSDASAHVSAVMWDNLDSATAGIGQIIKVAGVLEEYQGQKQLKIDKIRLAREDDAVDLTRLIPTTPRDRGMLWEQYQHFIDSLAQPHLLSLLRRIFADEEFVKAFCDTPGGKKWHHAYLGGLLEHTLNIATICDRLAKIYPQVDRDLLIAAALLHDIGKVDSYTHGPMFEFTDAGRLLGHIVLGAQLVAEKIRQFPEFPAELAMRLQHLILSHQGTLEQASPVVPMTPEGFLLYYADEIDSKMNAILRLIAKDQGEGKRWSEYVNLLGRYLYLGG
ncbi:MAG: 3'-5' exoribonuclease YhaM family protein [bacterium]